VCRSQPQWLSIGANLSGSAIFFTQSRGGTSFRGVVPSAVEIQRRLG
jgi:hypothetical protein